jgi:RNA polymerase sigma-70 factor (ECF subfamily)
MVAGSSSHADDAAVVRAVLDGDVEAFRWLVDRELPSVVRLATRVLGDAHEAEDVAQEAFVIAYRSLGTWRGDGPFGGWLARIAVRLAVRRAARRRTLPWAVPVDGSHDDEATTLLRDPALGPEGWAERGEAAHEVRLAVAALEEPYREVVALRFFGDRSLAEIAEITGRPIGTVKTHLRRGLLRLRGGLEGSGRR